MATTDNTREERGAFTLLLVLSITVAVMWTAGKLPLSHPAKFLTSEFVSNLAAYASAVLVGVIGAFLVSHLYQTARAATK